MQGRTPVLCAAVDRGPVLQQPAGGFHPAGQRRPHQGSHPGFRIHSVDIRPVPQVPFHGGDVPVPGGAPDVVFPGPGRLRFEGGRNRPAADPVDGGNDGHQPEQERQQHAAEAVGEHRFHAAAAPEHGGEEAAQQEEHRHSETVDRREQEPVEPALPLVLHRPRGTGRRTTPRAAGCQAAWPRRAGRRGRCGGGGGVLVIENDSG